MYSAYFGLSQEPFSIAPDPRYLYMSERHREALAHLLYGVGGSGGFVVLSGEIGTGKTTVCRCFLEQVPKYCNVAYIFNPRLTALELLRSVCEEFHITLPPGASSAKDCIDALNAFLLAAHTAGQRNVLIIDEAQNLGIEVLEQLRLLTNLETNERKLLQIILIGQPQLRELLARPELEQVSQRVIARFHLDALSADETAHYIQHRLTVAGLAGPLPFTPAALARVHRYSGGVPRRINVLCDRALLGAYAHGLSQVSAAVVKQAAKEVFGAVSLSRPRKQGPWWLWALLGVLLLLLISTSVLLWSQWTRTPTTTALTDKAAPLPPTTPPTPVAAPNPVSAASSTGAPLALAAQTAQQALAALWGIPAESGDICTLAQRAGLACFQTTQMTLNLLRRLDRPALLTLGQTSEPGRTALLLAMGPNSATLRMEGDARTTTLTLTQFTQRWHGDYFTLWRTPVGYTNTLREGAQGPAMDWLAAQLAALQGAAAPAGPQTLNATWQTRLQQFQRAQGLPADGRAGPLTLMQLSRASGVHEPKLGAALP